MEGRGRALRFKAAVAGPRRNTTTTCMIRRTVHNLDGIIAIVKLPAWEGGGGLEPSCRNQIKFSILNGEQQVLEEEIARA